MLCFCILLGIGSQAVLEGFPEGFPEVFGGFSEGFQGVFGARKGFSGLEVTWKCYVFIHPGLPEIVPSSPFIILKGEIEVKNRSKTSKHLNSRRCGIFFGTRRIFRPV
jgi:hypothetical protein